MSSTYSRKRPKTSVHLKIDEAMEVVQGSEKQVL